MNPFPFDNGNARASVVNRTHRVVREHALDMRAQQERTRSLWIPLAIFSVLLPGICYAAWSMLDGYNVTPNGIPDASDQLLLLSLWILPITAIALGCVWFRRSRNQEAQR
jgi:protein-S-isoprenylcysteine O-methyltransferase Ste14